MSVLDDAKQTLTDIQQGISNVGINLLGVAAPLLAIRWTTGADPTESTDAGVFIGHQGVLEWQRLADQAFETMQFHPERIDELPGGRTFAVSRFRFRARGSDMDAEVAFVHLITWRGDTATAVRMFTSEAAALGDLGLEA